MMVHKGLLSKEAAEEIFNIESVYLGHGNVIPFIHSNYYT